MKKQVLVFVFLVSTTLLPSLLNAQTKDGQWQISAGPGMTWNPPVQFDLDASGEYYLDDTFSVGGDFDIFIRGTARFGALAFGRYHFQLLQFPKFDSFVGGGAGALIDSNQSGWFDLMLPELGFYYELTPHLYVGPNVSFHVLLGSTNSWDLHTTGQLTYRF